MLPRTRGVMWTLAAAALLLGPSSAAVAQTPQPFPRPAQGQTAPPPPTTAPAQPATQQPAAPAADAGAPTEATLGAPVYPGAVYLGSYDAGRGQRFYLYGVLLSFAEAVQYYKATLKKNGDVLFQSPATHQFETTRYREETMAFPPSVTVKDYTSGGGPGYPNPKPGATPTHFPTVIQIVPAPQGVGQ